MTNLLKETEYSITSSKHTPEDVVSIGLLDPPRSCTWEEFQTIANEEYDSGYGGHEVLLDLIVLFKDGTRLERREYDGSEWWQFVGKVKAPKKAGPLVSPFVKDHDDE